MDGENREASDAPAVALASIAGANADAKEMKLPPGSNTANRMLSDSVHKKARTKTSSWEARVESREDAERALRYEALLKKMQGLYVHYRDSVVAVPQFEKFCEEISIFCDKFADHNPGPASDMALTPELFARIDTAHRDVNQKIAPMRDLAQYGVPEKWMISEKAGDCEDYVLLKMIRLINTGIDPIYMHILMVRDAKNEGHAVLGLDVLENDVRNTLVLDNLKPEVVTLSEMQEEYDGSLVSFIARDEAGNFSVRFYPYDSRGGSN